MIGDYLFIWVYLFVIRKLDILWVFAVVVSTQICSVEATIYIYIYILIIESMAIYLYCLQFPYHYIYDIWI